MQLFYDAVFCYGCRPPHGFIIAYCGKVVKRGANFLFTVPFCFRGVEDVAPYESCFALNCFLFGCIFGTIKTIPLES